MKRKQAKQSYLKKMKNVVASHVYDLGKKIIDDAEENAREEHNVKLGIHKNIKDIVKEVVAVNTKVHNYIKATKDEVAEVCREGSRQAIVALKNEKGSSDEMDSDEEFFKSLDIDIENDDEWQDMLGDDDDDFDEDDIGVESYMTNDDQPTVVSSMSDEDISAAIILLLASSPCSKFTSIYQDYKQDIQRIVENTHSKVVDQITNKSTNKLEMAKQMLDEVDAEMIPSISNEDMEESVRVIEVVKTELPTTIPEKKADLEICSRVHDTVEKIFSNALKSITSDKEKLAILEIAQCKLEAVIAYLATVTGISDLEIRRMILHSSANLDFTTWLGFYLGLIPAPIINEATRLISIYYNKIKK